MSPVFCLRLLLIVIAGLMHGSTWVFPGFWIGTWIGQGLLCTLAVQYSPLRALLVGMAVGCLGLGWAFAWAPESLQQRLDTSWLGAHIIFSLMVLWESMVFGLFAWVVARFARYGFWGLWLGPCAWAAAEFWWPRIFPWLLGYSQLENLFFIQIAEITGLTGIGFCISAVAMLPAAFILWRRIPDRQTKARSFYRFATVVACLFVVWCGFGWVRLSQWETELAHSKPLRIAVIQVDPTFNGCEAKFRERTFALHEDVDLVCWPESSIGSYCSELEDFCDVDRTRKMSLQLNYHTYENHRPAEGFRCDLLAGGKTFHPGANDDYGPYIMTAFVISPSQKILGRYFKRTLMPFGEYMPGESYFPDLHIWGTLQEFFEAGKDASPVTTSRGDRVGVVICYEDMLASNVHATVRAGAEILVSLINGSAFGDPRTLEQHKRLAHMRAVEHRRYFVRCSSTGVSCIISPTGAVVEQLDIGSEGSMIQNVKLIQAQTIYTQWGEFFPWTCTVIVAVGLMLTRKRRRASMRQGAPTNTTQVMRDQSENANNAASEACASY